jgi:hypothetical protein
VGGSLLKQVIGLNPVLRHAIAVVIYVSKIILSARITLFGSFAVPANCLCGVRRHPFASPIKEAESVLR